VHHYFITSAYIIDNSAILIAMPLVICSLITEFAPSATSSEISTPPLIPGFTFERFIIGPSNQFAAAAATAVAAEPGATYNPLLFTVIPVLEKPTSSTPSAIEPFTEIPLFELPT